jgi:hypothetical protein
VSERDLFVAADPVDLRPEIGTFNVVDPPSVMPRFREFVETSSLSLTSDSLNDFNDKTVYS